MSVSTLPYQAKTLIVEFLMNQLKPRKNIALSQKQKGLLKKKEESIIDILQRIAAQNQRKEALVKEIPLSDENIKKKVTKDLNKYIEDQSKKKRLPGPIERSLNYFKYVNHDFIQELINHPASDRIHISGHENDILVFLSFQRDKVNFIAVAHYPLPDDADFDIYSNFHVRRFLKKNTSKISRYEFIYDDAPRHKRSLNRK